MIEISISRELAAAHLGFVASCAERGHALNVFDRHGHAQPRQTAGAGTDLAREGDAGASTGGRTQGDGDPTA